MIRTELKAVVARFHGLAAAVHLDYNR